MRPGSRWRGIWGEGQRLRCGTKAAKSFDVAAASCSWTAVCTVLLWFSGYCLRLKASAYGERSLSRKRKLARQPLVEFPPHAGSYFRVGALITRV